MTAFRGGQVLGFVLVGLALLILEVIIATFRASWFDGVMSDGSLEYDEINKETEAGL